MIPTEQGKRFIRQAQRVLQQVDELAQEAHQQRSCAELRVVLTHATYASYAAVDFLQQAARSEQLRVHIRVTAAAQDYEAFYEEEIRYRQIMGYPPVENLLAVLVSCEDEVLLETGCKYLKEFSIRIAPKETAKIIGPASPGIGKINDVYRKVIYIKDENYDTLVRIKNGLEQYIEVNPGYRKMRIQFDFNPMHVF